MMLPNANATDLDNMSMMGIMKMSRMTMGMRRMMVRRMMMLMMRRMTQMGR